jgi:Exo-beta-D-glucosaminidase Ig-fold domain
VAVSPSSTATAFSVPFAGSLPSPHLLRLTLTGPDGGTLSGNTYWRYRAATDLQALNQLAPARVSASAGPVTSSAAGSGAGSGGSRQKVVSLRNTGSSVAAMLTFSVRDRRSGDRILPAFYSESYLWLLPGESRQVTVSWGRGAQGDGVPEVVVEGYNLASLTV